MKINQNYYSQTLKLKLKMSMKIFSSQKEMFDFSNYLTKSKYYNNSKKLIIGKMKDETGGVAIEEFVELKPKLYSSQKAILTIKKQKV